MSHYLTISRTKTYEHPWARAMSKLAGFLYVTGLVSGTSASSTYNLYEIAISIGLNPRPYVLWRLREHWFHLPRYRHGYHEIRMGFCGKCAPWLCCGSPDYNHASDCSDHPGMHEGSWT